MSLIVITGPMKSGKSLELIARVSPYKYTKQAVVLLQSARNVRDAKVASRVGLEHAAEKVSSLKDYQGDAEVIGIDEVHMFTAQDVDVIRCWLKEGREVIASGLDLDYRGKLMDTMRALLELKPDMIVDNKAVCEYCGIFDAHFTCIEKNGKKLKSGLPAVVPDDGTYRYVVACRNCF